MKDVMNKVKKMSMTDKELLKEYLDQEEKKKENGVNNKMEIEIKIPLGKGKHGKMK